MLKQTLYESSNHEQDWCEVCHQKFDVEDLYTVQFNSCSEHICLDCYKKEIVRNAIEQTNGRFFSVSFIKKDGTERKMLARTGCKVGINGNGYFLKEETKANVIRIYDIIKKAWRTITFENVFEFKCGNVGNFNLDN